MRRWEGEVGSALAREVIARLQSDARLDDLQLGEYGGRVDLRGLPASPVPVGKERRVGSLVLQPTRGIVELTGRTLSDCDFSGSLLDDWRFRDCQIANCCFDRSRCQRWALWHSQVTACTFIGADLRGGLLGTYPEGGRVSWNEVDFSRADLRGTSALCAQFNQCDFCGGPERGV